MSEEKVELTDEEKKELIRKEVKKFIIPILRRATFRWPHRYNAQKNARMERGIYECKECGAPCKPKEFILDHIEPVVPVEEGFTTWDNYINRMFVGEDGYQVLCHLCSEAKTSIEDSLRAEYNRLRKDKKKEEEKATKALTKKKKKDPIKD